MMPELSVNIDHVATVRQARCTFEPDPIQAAQEAQLGGADGITVHLREDRRHIQDEDVDCVVAAYSTPPAASCPAHYSGPLTQLLQALKSSRKILQTHKTLLPSSFICDKPN